MIITIINIIIICVFVLLESQPPPDVQQPAHLLEDAEVAALALQVYYITSLVLLS